MKIMHKKVYIRTFGCQMNVRDSEVICGLLKKEGYEITEQQDKADILIFNTCSVRQHAEDKVWSEIGRYAKRKKKETLGTVFKGRETLGTVPLGKHSRVVSGTVPIIGIAGCMARNYKEYIFERAPGVSFVIGPQDLHKIPETIRKLSDKSILERKIWETEGEVRPDEIYHTGFFQDKEHAYIVISEGCANFCSYCVVPYVRGPLRNRGAKEILDEVREAADKGITRITLLGQNVNAYKHKDVDFAGLLGMVNAVKGLSEFGFVTSHPKDTSLELFRAMQDADKLKKCLHLPMQSGSDRILKLMNRGYTRKFYLELAEKYRTIVRGGALTTDIIVGFPTETEADFQDTYDLVKEIAFNAAYIFKYSPRPHTEAALMVDDLPKEEKERRHGLILELQKDISKNKKC